MTDIDNDDGGQPASTTPPATQDPPKGQFYRALSQSNSKIRLSRALQLAESTKTVYRRRVEDLVNEVRMLVLDAQGALDLRGDSAMSLKPAIDFDANDWVNQDINRRMEIRNKTTKLAVAYYGYAQNFGDEPAMLNGVDISHVEMARINIPLLEA